MDRNGNFLSGDMRTTIDRHLQHSQISKGIEVFRNESNYNEDKLLTVLEAIIEVVAEAQSQCIKYRDVVLNNDLYLLNEFKGKRDVEDKM